MTRSSWRKSSASCLSIPRRLQHGVSAVRLFDEPVQVCVGDGLGTVTGVDLGEQAIDMALDRDLADDEVLGYLGVGQADGR